MKVVCWHGRFGPGAQLAIQSAWMLGDRRVIAIDQLENPLKLARTKGRSETINFEAENVQERLLKMIAARGPDRCIDAVGAEAHSAGTVREFVDDAREVMHVTSNHPDALGEAILCWRKGSTVSTPGVYTSTLGDVPMHEAMIVSKSF